MEVGFLGLGIMGRAMSMNLLRHGFKVTVWNRTLSKCDELVEHGALIGETPAAVVKKCKYTIAMLSDPLAALSVVFDKDGVLGQICNGKGYVDMSTVDADTSFKICEAITSRGGSFLEAPVSGSKKPAEDGQLVILAAGDKALYEEVLPAFDVLGKKSFFLGEVGNGAKMKLVVNMTMGSMMNAFSEGLTLAGKSGLNPQTLLDVLDLSAISNPMFRMKGPTMIQNNYTPAFPLKHQQKDMRLALAIGDENAISMPVAAAANEVLNSGKKIGNDKEYEGLYYFEEEDNQTSQALTTRYFEPNTRQYQIMLWHYRLGHPSFKYLKHLYPTLFKNNDNFQCEIFQLAKHQRSVFKPQPYKATKHFSMIHSDIWGPSRSHNIYSKRWFVIFIDDHTRVCWVYLLKDKSGVEQVFINFHNMIKNQYDTNIQVLYTDNGREYFSQVLGCYLNNRGIIHQSSCLNTPQQNGIA